MIQFLSTLRRAAVLLFCLYINGNAMSAELSSDSEVASEPQAIMVDDGGEGGLITAGIPASITYPSTSDNGNFVVSWGTASYVDYFELFESINGGTFSLIATVNTGTPLQRSMSGKANGSYIYRVRACADRCGGFRTGGALTVAIPPAPTATLTANTTTIKSGDNVTLSYSSTNAKTCELNGSILTLPSGSKIFYGVAATTTYTLVCRNISGTVSKSVTVKVATQPTLTISANPINLATGGATAITWRVNGELLSVPSCAINDTSVTKSPVSYTKLTASKTFTLSCSYLGNVYSKAVTVNVAPLPTVTLTSDKSAVEIDGMATLSWSLSATPYTKTCTLNGVTVATNVTSAASGTQKTEAIDTNRIFTLDCLLAGGVKLSRTVNVTAVVAWQNKTICDPLTGNVTQECVNASFCTVGSTRTLKACPQTIVPCGQ